MTNPYDKGATLEARVVRQEVLSAQAFLALKETAPAEIKSSRPVGPVLGTPGFGGIEVTYTTPKFRVL